MISWSNAFRAVLLVCVFAVVVAAAVTFSLVQTNMDVQQRQAWEDLQWTSSQLEIEYLRFAKTIASIEHGNVEIDNAEVVKRFNILWSRITLFDNSRTKQRLSFYPLEATPAFDLLDTLKLLEPAVLSLQAGDEVSAKHVLAVIAKHAKPLRDFNRGVMHGEQQLEKGIRQKLFASTTQLTQLGIGAALISLVLLIIFAVESASYQRMSNENKSLLHSSQLANRTKSRFLTMMSHELRTPMNGILGTLALAKHQGVSPQQEWLLNKATDSSRRMNGLLSDILDFAALEDPKLKVSSDLFEVSALRDSILEALALSERDQGGGFKVDIAKNCPPRLKGDIRRLRQSIVHLADYLAQTAATRSVAINIDCTQQEFRILLSHVYGETDTDWTPRLVLGELDRGAEIFASDALGPAIARGFIEKMGGTITLFHPDPAKDHTIVCVSVPLQIVSSGDPVVRLAIQSGTLAVICKSMLAAQHVQICQDDYNGPVSAILIEVGAEWTDQMVQEMRCQYPQAMLVALGLSAKPDQFDRTLALPIDATDLHSAVLAKVAA